MSRIQDILNKAERDGTARRTRGLSDNGGVQAPAAATPAAAPSVPTAGPPVTTFDAPPPPAPWAAPTTPPPLDHHAIPSAVAHLDHRLVAAVSPQSLAAEQYRLLRTRVRQAERGRTIRTIVVTSPSQGDGKSLTAANLALAMAQEFHQRVLLIDADFRRPSIARLFGLHGRTGLSDVLLGGAEVDAALVSIAEHRLTVLPSGSVAMHPAELLGSSGMRRVLDTLRTRFDRILIDMPPVAPVADVHVVAPMTDGLLMVVRAGVTAKPAIERALAGLDASKVLGLVLNDAEEAPHDRTSYEGYRYIAG
jgi:capsular exopolysaccharide synthesis family protein